VPSGIRAAPPAALASSDSTTAGGGSNNNNKRKEPPSAAREEAPVPEKDTAPAKNKKAKSTNDIKEEVRQLPDENLVDTADAVKLKTLVTLVARLYSGTVTRTPANDRWPRRLSRKVLTVLRQELDKGEAANGLIVQALVRSGSCSSGTATPTFAIR
jgi:hypothetical protein